MLPKPLVWFIGKEATMAGSTRTGKDDTTVEGDAWTPEELAEARARLAQEIEELRSDIERAESQMASGENSETDGDDEADAGLKTFEREREIALTLNARDLLAQNERAIARIDAGTYGVCESCQRPIGKERLRAFPRATLCVACKQREERR
jgi:DnaK suppressor protein